MVEPLLSHGLQSLLFLLFCDGVGLLKLLLLKQVRVLEASTDIQYNLAICLNF